MSDPFITNLQCHTDAVERFVTLLETEQSMLTDSPTGIDALSRLTERKTAQAVQLERLDEERRSLLVERGYTADREGGAQLAKVLGCQTLWQAFIARVEAARGLNRTNGQAIDNRLDFTNRTLAFLQHATGQTLYGPNGRARSLGGNHSVSSGV